MMPIKLKDFCADRNSVKTSNRKSKFFAPLAQLAEQVTLNYSCNGQLCDATENATDLNTVDRTKNRT